MPLFILLFTVIPALELYLLFKVGGEIGGGNTILIIILTGVIGASLAKSQGLSILMKIQNEFGQGSLPGNHIIQGLMVFAGGLLLLTPGFMTDIIGFSLVIPGPRHLLMHWVKKLVISGLESGNIHFSSFGQHYQKKPGQPWQESDSETFRQREIKPGVFEADYKHKDDK